MVKVKTVLIRQPEEEMFVGKGHCSYIWNSPTPAPDGSRRLRATGCMWMN